jgi:hypothetical protein
MQMLPDSRKMKKYVRYAIFGMWQIKYDEPNYGNGYRGQPTTVRSLLDTNSSWIEAKTKYS